MSNRVPLEAKEGYILTDGKTYGKLIWIADGENPEEFYEITEAEYERILAEKMQAVNEVS